MKQERFNRLDEWLDEHSVSSRSFCNLMGWSQQSTYNVRSGLRDLSLPAVYDIAGKLGCHPFELLRGFKEYEKDKIVPEVAHLYEAAAAIAFIKDNEEAMKVLGDKAEDFFNALRYAGGDFGK